MSMGDCRKCGEYCNKLNNYGTCHACRRIEYAAELNKPKIILPESEAIEELKKKVSSLRAKIMFYEAGLIRIAGGSRMNMHFDDLTEIARNTLTKGDIKGKPN